MVAKEQEKRKIESVSGAACSIAARIASIMASTSRFFWLDMD